MPGLAAVEVTKVGAARAPTSADEAKRGSKRSFKSAPDKGSVVDAFDGRATARKRPAPVTGAVGLCSLAASSQAPQSCLPQSPQLPECIVVEGEKRKASSSGVEVLPDLHLNAVARKHVICSP